MVAVAPSASVLALAPEYALEAWQRRALDDWAISVHPRRGARHGIFDMFTGAGKTVLALAAMVDAAADVPDLRLAIVVPTAALMHQWVEKIPTVLRGVSAGSVGACGAGRDDSFATHRFVVYVINSAREHLANHVRGHRVMLVVDECHRAASEKNQAIFQADTLFRLGLSATAQRTDLVDDAGKPLAVEDQPHGKALGPICHRLTFKDAMREGLLPRYEIHHHKLALSKVETEQYDALSRECSDADRTFRLSGAHSSYLNYVRKRVRGATTAQSKAAHELQNAYLRRKQWLYRVGERNRVAARVLGESARRARADGRTIRAMLFNERVGDPDDGSSDEPEAADAARDEGATALFEALRGDVEASRLDLGGLGPDAVALEHSRLAGRARDDALRGFREGRVRVLVSVKALTEGIDVPDADVGVSVASTSSARQRIQTLGRLLRAPRDRQGKRLSAVAAAALPLKQLHLLYVGGTADEAIYVGKDWTDETGEAQNRWWTWPFGAEEAKLDEAPPKPPPSEEAAWDEIARLPMPQPWRGAPIGEKWTYRQNAVVAGTEGPEAQNPTEVIRLLDAIGRRAGRDFRGLFLVTPNLGVVLKISRDTNRPEGGWVACGRLGAALVPGDPSEIAASPAGAQPRVGRGWLELFERGLHAAVDGDQAAVRACRAALKLDPVGRKHGAKWLEPLESPEPSSTEDQIDVRHALAADLMESGVRAYARGQTALLRRCRGELLRRAAATGKARGKLSAFGAALAILLNE